MVRTQGTIEPRRARASLAGTALALLAGPLALLLIPAPAEAACTQFGGVTPTLNLNIDNQSFGGSFPNLDVVNRGLDGCAGADGGNNDNGGPGAAGDTAWLVTVSAQNVTLLGDGVSDGIFTWGGRITSLGATGGNGGQGGQPVVSFVAGGAGGNAGGAAAMTITAALTIEPDLQNGGRVPDIGFEARLLAGTGGIGGGTGTCCSGSKGGGAGGRGGGTQDISFTGSGDVQAGLGGIAVGAVGGAGGSGGSVVTGDLLNDNYGGTGGNGGVSGAATLVWNGGDENVLSAGVFGLRAYSHGGFGGNGGTASTFGGQPVGAAGGAGGNGAAAGNAAVVHNSGTIRIGSGIIGIGGINPIGAPANPDLPSAGVIAQSIGGSGGPGAVANSSFGSSGGKGGAGGNAGSASVTLLASELDYFGNGTNQAAAVAVISNGGPGGAGGEASAIAGSAGGGGLAGAGGAATLIVGSTTQAVTLRAFQAYVNAAVVQSVGGGGGTGGIANAGFNTQGGAGAAGGDGGLVTVDGVNGKFLTFGRSGAGIIAQSVGGGGGIGGDANAVSVGASLAIGGNGGLGGNGAAVNVTLGAESVIGALDVEGDAGILAQSIGGSGGTAGSASSSGVAFLTMTVGGDASGGGTGGAITLRNDGIITTNGDHAAGVRGQSIGGGGGDGGAGYAFGVGVLPTAAVAVGGRGGSGGPAGAVSLVNNGQITAYGPDAFGVQVQSIGGGGGSGGSATARAIALSPDKRIPAVSMAVSVGGQGGSGNTGGKVDLINNNMVLTAGDGGTAVFAQSVGGGGGNGGDSTAASYAGGPQAGISVSLATAVGGSGGSGGLGGAVTLANSGLIATLGQDSFGVFAQSIGGGGGKGGTGDASASAKDAKGSFAVSVAVGGSGGTGGHAGAVTLSNGTGSITTSGDGSDGVVAQSVGGGGGVGTGGVGTAAGGKLAVSVDVGGSGGAGGNGSAATVSSGGAVITRGSDAVGIFAQSVGGGGGKGGKGSATAGGVTDESNAQALFDTVAGGFNGSKKVTKVVDGIFKLGEIGEAVTATKDELRDLLKQPQAPEPGEKEESQAVQINVAVAVGGRGGAAGTGGAASVTNNGLVTTFGAQSDAIFAQSVGGGGGRGGGTTSTGSASDEGQYQTAIAVGGVGAGGGDGGTVSVVNGTGGTILTQGVGAFGISAHSVGGGGGSARTAGALSGSLKSFSIGLGGDGGAGGNGGQVSVTTGDGTAASTLTTTGKHGIAIIAQSVGGGGGIAHSITDDQTFDPKKLVDNPQGRIADVQGFKLEFGGKNGAAGNGGAVGVTTSGLVSTSGLGAHGILAQSIGGGGGLVVGGQHKGGTNSGGSGSANSNGGTATLDLKAGTAVRTSGDGAFGILAQSVGGGGGTAGDMSGALLLTAGVLDDSGVRAGTGNGGNVVVNLTSASVQATGAQAHGIFAQSVGGGGGLIALGQVLQSGTAGGAGSGGSISVTLVNSQVAATGIDAAGILAQSDGTSKNAIRVSIDNRSSVVGGGLVNPSVSPLEFNQAIADIRLLGGSGNVVDNAGTIGGFADNYSGLSIILVNSLGTNSINNTGTIIGIIDQVGSTINMGNRAGGVLLSRTINLGSGTLTNDGTLHVGGAGRIGGSAITGNLVQGPGGRLLIEADPASGAADLITVTGTAVIGGTVDVRASSVSNRPVTVLTATGGVSLAPGLTSLSASELYSYRPAVVGQTLQVGTDARFASAAAPLGGNSQQVAGHLQTLFDSGASYDAGFTALSGVRAVDYGDTLDALSGQGLGAIGALRFELSNGFVEQLLGGCGAFEVSTERGTRCGWARMIGASTDQDGNADALGFHASTGLFQLGYEAGLGGDWSASLSLAYGFEQIDGDNALARVSGESVTVGGYLRYHPGALQLTLAADGGYGWYDSRRQVAAGTVNGVALGEPEAWHIGGHAEARYRFERERVYIQPFARLHVVHAASKGFTETGLQQFNLVVESGSNTALAGSAGVEISGNMPVRNGGFVRPFIRASYVLLQNNDWDTTARFADQPEGTPSFVVNTRAPDRLTRLAMGLNILHDNRVDLSVQYAPDFGEDYSRHSGVARLTVRF